MDETRKEKEKRAEARQEIAYTDIDELKEGLDEVCKRVVTVEKAVTNHIPTKLDALAATDTAIYQAIVNIKDSLTLITDRLKHYKII